MLDLSGVSVCYGGKEIVRSVDLTVRKGERHAIFGPNGSGKSTLIKAIAGVPGLKVDGVIRLDDREIQTLEMWERVKAGLYVVFQHKPRLKGVRVDSLLVGVDDVAKRLGVEGLLTKRFEELSGGEWKMVEVLFPFALGSKVVCFDEIDAGLDMERMKLVGKVIQDFFDTCLVVTHRGSVLDVLDVDYGHVMIGGRMTPNSDPKKILETIKEHGYGKCYRCFNEDLC